MAKMKARKLKEEDQELLRKVLGIVLALAVTTAVILIINYLFLWHPQPWSLDKSGHLSFPARGQVEATSTITEDKPQYMLEKAVYKSFDDNVYALLRVPKNVQKPPAVIILPGATVNKSSDMMGVALADAGYATFTLDERGNMGETPGPFSGYPPLGYTQYLDGEDPVQYKQVYDVLMAYDYLKTRQDIDTDNIAVLGESMGGRFAIITAALEPGIKGVIVVSSSDYGLVSEGDSKADMFIKSIEPSGYVSKVSPRKVAMFQFKNDSVISADMAKALYDKAEEPKSWYIYEGDVHGVYSDVYVNDLKAELKEIFGR